MISDRQESLFISELRHEILIKNSLLILEKITKDEVHWEKHKNCYVQLIPYPSGVELKWHATLNQWVSRIEGLLVYRGEAGIADEEKHPDVEDGLPSGFFTDDQWVLEGRQPLNFIHLALSSLFWILLFRIIFIRLFDTAFQSLSLPTDRIV